MTAALLLAGVHRVAVGEQQRVGALVRVDGGGEAAEHVRAVREEGDAAEALRLALGAVHAVGAVQAFQGGVVFRLDAHHRGQGEVVRGAGDHQPRAVQAVVVAGVQFTAVQGQRAQLQVLAIEHQILGLVGALRVAAQGQVGGDQGVAVAQVHIQGGVRDQPGGRLVVRQAGDRVGLSVSHQCSPFRPAGRRETGCSPSSSAAWLLQWLGT